MCLAVPGMVVSIDENIDPTLRQAKVDFSGVRREVSLAFTPEARPGDYVLVHVGFALQVVDEAEAQKIFEALKAKGAFDSKLTWDSVVAQALEAVKPLIAEVQALQAAIEADLVVAAKEVLDLVYSLYIDLGANGKGTRGAGVDRGRARPGGEGARLGRAPRRPVGPQDGGQRLRRLPHRGRDPGVRGDEVPRRRLGGAARDPHPGLCGLPPPAGCPRRSQGSS